MKWQRATRAVVAIVAVACVAWVGFTVRPRPKPRAEPPVVRSDPKALVESAGGFGFRVNKSREEVRIEYDKMLTYQDGSNKMVGVKVTTDRNGRTFVINGAEGQVGHDESIVELTGGVRAVVSDGLSFRTDHASFSKADGIARAPGPVEFSRGRMSGTGIGLTFDNTENILTILDQAVVTVVPDEKGSGGMNVAAGALEFRRNEGSMRFDRAMTATRERETIEADSAVAHLTADEEHLEAVELRGRSRIGLSGAAAGGLQGLAGRDIDLKYGPDGKAIEHALISGEGVIQLAGESGKPGRTIGAESLEVSLADDGATPTALVGRENVTLNLPGEQGGVTRTIAAQTIESHGAERRGLTSAHFSGGVQFTERGPDVMRTARSEVLDAALQPATGSIDEATFSRGVRFVDGSMTATSVDAHYLLGPGTLELTGSDAANPTPHVVNEQIMVDATRIDVTLSGPHMVATGSARSVLQGQKPGAPGKAASAVHLPSMLKQDQPVNVTGDYLDYEGDVSRATYTGNAQLWQGDTQIKSWSMVIDNKTGNLSALGPVATVSMLEQEDKDGKKERVRSLGTSTEFTYQDMDRRATYTGDAHMNGPQGDLTAYKIELYLKPSGDELERVEAYENVTLHSDTQKTTGARLTYFGDEGRYVVHGTPVTIVDECGRETIGRTLTFFKATDRIIVDGNEQVRTQTKGKSNCPAP